MPERSERASQHQMQAFFDNLIRELDRVEFLRPAEKRDTMLVNLRNIFTRMEPTKQDMHTLHGVVMAIAEGRKGPAKGGVLDGEQATRLRALLAEHGQGGGVPDSGSTVRGLARLLRRNPTDAERLLWQALTRDRRFAGGFKRQTPVGRHIPDFVSFPHRIAIELVNAGEGETIAADRAARRAWLEARDYRVIEMRAADVERDMEAELVRLQGMIEQGAVDLVGKRANCLLSLTLGRCRCAIQLLNDNIAAELRWGLHVWNDLGLRTHLCGSRCRCAGADHLAPKVIRRPRGNAL